MKRQTLMLSTSAAGRAMANEFMTLQTLQMCDSVNDFTTAQVWRADFYFYDVRITYYMPKFQRTPRINITANNGGRNGTYFTYYGRICLRPVGRTCFASVLYLFFNI